MLAGGREDRPESRNDTGLSDGTGTVREAPPFSWLASLTPTIDPAVPSRAAAFFGLGLCFARQGSSAQARSRKGRPVRRLLAGSVRRATMVPCTARNRSPPPSTPTPPSSNRQRRA